ncbi:MAG TPA: hypothetical protein H9902_16240 [Candidatus Stackebrandtia faecavium]|nr:hypothetical protein [Candidatus Stackebrandtia faecavium]
MDQYEICRETMRAIALGDDDKAHRLYRQLDAAGEGVYEVALTMMFLAALQVRFGTADLDLAAAQGFASELQADHADTEPPVLESNVESLIRGVWSEEHLLDGLERDEEERLQHLAIRKIYSDSDDMQQRFDDYLADVENMTRYWVANEALPD